MAHLANKAGFKQHIINRIDPVIKNQLATAQALHFNWVQGFEDQHEESTKMFTHTMPYSYQGCKDCGPVKEVIVLIANGEFPRLARGFASPP